MGNAAACWKLEEVGSQVREIDDGNFISEGMQERLVHMLHFRGGQFHRWIK